MKSFHMHDGIGDHSVWCSQPQDTDWLARIHSSVVTRQPGTSDKVIRWVCSIGSLSLCQLSQYKSGNYDSFSFPGSRSTTSLQPSITSLLLYHNGAMGVYGSPSPVCIG